MDVSGCEVIDDFFFHFSISECRNVLLLLQGRLRYVSSNPILCLGFDKMNESRKEL
jgi:hypothetical protein